MDQLLADTQKFPEGVTRRLAKHIFLDVVEFSKRKAEAQSDIVMSLNQIVRAVLEKHQINQDDDCILIPTGDGMCLAVLRETLPYHSHLRIAIDILGAISEHNECEMREARRFDIRIGLNQNQDIIVTDINGHKNIAGAGINLAARIMDKADGGQILVSEAVYLELEPSPNFSTMLHQQSSKHGNSEVGKDFEP